MRNEQSAFLDTGIGGSDTRPTHPDVQVGTHDEQLRAARAGMTQIQNLVQNTNNVLAGTQGIDEESSRELETLKESLQTADSLLGKILDPRVPASASEVQALSTYYHKILSAHLMQQSRLTNRQILTEGHLGDIVENLGSQVEGSFESFVSNNAIEVSTRSMAGDLTRTAMIAGMGPAGMLVPLIDRAVGIDNLADKTLGAVGGLVKGTFGGAGSLISRVVRPEGGVVDAKIKDLQAKAASKKQDFLDKREEKREEALDRKKAKRLKRELKRMNVEFDEEGWLLRKGEARQDKYRKRRLERIAATESVESEAVASLLQEAGVVGGQVQARMLGDPSTQERPTPEIQPVEPTPEPAADPTPEPRRTASSSADEPYMAPVPPFEDSARGRT